ncbi:MAG: molybdenum cofactor guanylyltransferase [Acidobacteria bacterium]|nr:molybdenum cofactor guanylyltransferase [Acidobacteriota bacterium]MCA1610767.1 molybdenum cofactor guanylyltransferase [Acidobacteriota bacterium]
MRIAMPAAVLAGGASRRMGSSKAALPYGSGTLAEHQTGRLGELFSPVWLVVRDPPPFSVAPALVLFDGERERSALSGLVRALEEAEDRVFVLAVDLPLLPLALARALAERSLESQAPAVLPEVAGRLEPLAGVWRRASLPGALRRARDGDRSLRGLAEDVGAEAFSEAAWRALDPSGNAFTNLNTVQDWATARERA